MADPAPAAAEAITAFRAAAELMGVHGPEVDDLIEAARASAETGEISLSEALHQELAELAVHLGHEG